MKFKKATSICEICHKEFEYLCYNNKLRKVCDDPICKREVQFFYFRDYLTSPLGEAMLERIILGKPKKKRKKPNQTKQTLPLLYKYRDNLDNFDKNKLKFVKQQYDERDKDYLAVYSLLKQGFKLFEISKALNLTNKEVQKHIWKIKNKLDSPGYICSLCETKFEYLIKKANRKKRFYCDECRKKVNHFSYLKYIQTPNGKARKKRAQKKYKAKKKMEK